MTNALEYVSEQLSDVETFHASLADVTPIWTTKIRSDGSRKSVIQAVEVGGKQYKTSSRFFRSICSRFHFGASIFNYFEPDEVFDRICDVQGDTFLNMTTNNDTALAVAGINKPIVDPDVLMSVLSHNQAKIVDAKYKDGIVKTTHAMKEGWVIGGGDGDGGNGGDAFQQTFTLETPIDGYGLPSIYLSLIRQICTNGMVGYAPAFKSEIQLGKDNAVEIPLARALESFNNEEGFQSLRQRLEAAQSSWASLNEVRRLRERMYKAFAIEVDDDTGAWKDVRDNALDQNKAGEANRLQQMIDVSHKLSELTGNEGKIYNIATSNAISTKKQRLLPMHCTVYQAFNFATELATHHLDLMAQVNQLHAWVGDMLSNEYDLEGSAAEYSDAKRLADRNNKAFIIGNEND